MTIALILPDYHAWRLHPGVKSESFSTNDQNLDPRVKSQVSGTSDQGLDPRVKSEASDTSGQNLDSPEDQEKCPKHSFSICVRRKSGYDVGKLFPPMVSERCTSLSWWMVLLLTTLFLILMFKQYPTVYSNEIMEWSFGGSPPSDSRKN